VRTPKSRTKENEVAELSGDLKAAAMQLGVPLMVAAQLNRDAEGNRRPTLRHLRDSGAIEQDADNVLLLHRDRDAETVVLTIAKQRNGLAGIELDLPFDPKLTRFDGSTDDGARF
jgi:replicative DNA helicase